MAYRGSAVVIRVCDDQADKQAIVWGSDSPQMMILITLGTDPQMPGLPCICIKKI